ncbi:MAG: glycosyltransferase, partial [Candidatus Saccharimonadales bacterium]
TFLVIGAGQVQPRKRVDLFLEAAKALPEVTFVWVGGIPFGRAAADYMAMKKLMNSNLPNIHFPGQVVLDDMVDFYHAADLFWLPSEQETFGLVVPEAAASGLPVLLRDINDYNHTFREFVDMAGDNTFIDHISRFASDKSFRVEYITLAEKLAQQFDSRIVTDQLVVLYRQLIKARY